MTAALSCSIRYSRSCGNPYCISLRFALYRLYPGAGARHAGGRPTLTLRPQVLARPWSPADARGLTSTATWSRAKVPLDIFVADELFMDCERRGAPACREVDQGQVWSRQVLPATHPVRTHVVAHALRALCARMRAPPSPSLRLPARPVL